MSLSMYQASIPVFIHQLNNLKEVLKKAENYAPAKKIDLVAFVDARLIADMFPFSRQVQIACDIVKGGAARLAGVEVPSYPDTEKTFPELYARIDKTIDFLKTFTSNQIDGTEEKKVTLKIGGKEMTFLGQPYLLHFVLPNLYFHTAMAYAILRKNGVDVGKMDYLGKF